MVGTQGFGRREYHAGTVGAGNFDFADQGVVGIVHQNAAHFAEIALAYAIEIITVGVFH